MNTSRNQPQIEKCRFAVTISANTEWQVVRRLYPQVQPQHSPFGEWFVTDISLGDQVEPVLFFQGGWGKISAAASSQYIIDHCAPTLLINLGTCGGFRGDIEVGQIILVDHTLVYDIVEQMGSQAEALAHYATSLDLSWLGNTYPHPVRKTGIISGDRDIVGSDVAQLRQTFGVVVADWESAAIAYVAHMNQVKCLILRGVTDLVDAEQGDAYEGNIHVFAEGTAQIMERLIANLPTWLTCISDKL